MKPNKLIVYAPMLAEISKRIEKALRGLDGVTFDLTLEAAYWPDQTHSPHHERLWVNLWFFREFRKPVQAGFCENLDKLYVDVRLQAKATLAMMKDHFGKKGGKRG